MKNIRILELISSTLLMLSKYFLSISSIWGWWLSVAGYLLTTILNIKIKLRIASVIVFGLALLSFYGLYKWSNQIVGLQLLDFIVIISVIIFSFFITIKEMRNKRPFWLIQIIIVILFSSAFILLGLKNDLGWYALLIGHINNTYLYYKK